MRKVTLKKFIVSIATLGLLINQTKLVYSQEIVINGNGSGSNSEVNLTQASQTTVNQTNQANIENNVTTEANTGENSASGNTASDVRVTTGNVTSKVQVESGVNLSVVDIGCCPSGTNVIISGNGAGSQNNVDLSLSANTNITVNQRANIANYVYGSANTGRNSADDNTASSITIQTGNVKVSGQVKNDPVNVSHVSATSGVGGVSVVIKNNGSDSQNSVVLNLESNTEIFINSEANFDNYVTWDLNTGENSANGNTGANIDIDTGDIDFTFFIDNSANFSDVTIDCCPGKGEVPPPSPTPTPTPTAPPSGGGDGGKPSDGGGISAGKETGAGGPGLLGLAVTSGGNSQLVFLLMGAFLLLVGSKVLSEEAHEKIYSKIFKKVI